MTRIGVLYSDGSLCIMMPRKDKDGEIEEALDMIEGANRGVTDARKMAKLVDVDLPATAVRERL